jgi:hypothetical protein
MAQAEVPLNTCPKARNPRRAGVSGTARIVIKQSRFSDFSFSMDFDETPTGDT